VTSAHGVVEHESISALSALVGSRSAGLALRGARGAGASGRVEEEAGETQTGAGRGEDCVGDAAVAS